MSIYGTIPEWIQAVCAGVALVGLYRYTNYTNDIRVATLSAQRSAIEPLLLCSFKSLQNGKPIFELLNIGNGPALNVEVATIPLPRGLGTFFDISSVEKNRLGALLPHGQAKLFESFFGERALGITIIIQASDVSGDLHQLQLAVLAGGTSDTIIREARVSDRAIEPVERKRKVVTDANGRNY